MLKIFLPLLLVTFTAHANYELEAIIHTQDNIQEPENDSSDDSIDSEALGGLNASSGSLDDVLRLSPYATTARGPRSSAEAPQIRGLDSNKVFVKIDGARQNFKSGHSSMVAMDLENLKEVSIYKSSSEVSNFGSIGGGVNFVTKDAEDILKKGKTIGSEFKVQHNSANWEKTYNGKFAYKNKSESGYISLTNSNAQDLSLSNGKKLGHSAYTDNALLFKHRVKRLKFKFEHFQREDNAPIIASIDAPESMISLFSDNTVRKNNFSINYNGKNHLDLMAYINRYESIKKRKEDSAKEIREIETLGLKVSKKSQNWYFGAEGYKDELDSDLNGEAIISYPEAKGENFAFYIERSFHPTPTIQLVPGLRQNHYTLNSKGDMSNQTEQVLSKNLKAIKSIADHSQIRFNYSEGFNAPRVNEVYPSGLHSPGDGWIMRDNFFIPNEDLTVETSKNVEVSWKYASSFFNSNDFVEFEVSAYENDVKDYIFLERIDRSTLDDKDGTTQFINVPEVKLWGHEVSLRYLVNSVDTKLSYSQVRGRNKRKNLFLEDLPADQYNFDMKYYLDKQDLTLGYLGHLALRQDRVNSETIQKTVSTSGYLIHNIYLSKKIDDFHINFRIDNFTDRKYRKHASHLYEASRDIKLAIKYKINTI